MKRFFASALCALAVICLANSAAARAGEPVAADSESGWKLTGGGGFYILQPHFKNNPAVTVSRTNPDTGILNITQTDFSYDASIAPYAWIGASMCNGFGARARVFHFDDTVSLDRINDGLTAIDSAAPLGLQNLSTTAGDRLVFSTSLNMLVVDIEGTHTAKANGWDMTFSGGVRWARLQQTYNHSETPLGGEVDAVDSEHTFSGAGPIVGIELRRALGCSGFSLFGSARGAVLFGSGDQDASQRVDNELSTTASVSHDDVLAVTELELGAEYARDMGRYRLFVQAGFVGHVWFGAGNGANNEMIPVLVDPEVSDNSTNLGLIGGRLSIGIQY